MKNSRQSDCGTIFSERLKKDVLVRPKQGEPCSKARARVEADHKLRKPRSMRPDLKEPMKGEIE
jgi:hypothetical protein